MHDGDEEFCAHGALRDAGCLPCGRDKLRGREWANEQLRDDPGFRREVLEVAKEIVLEGRKKLCREAVQAAMRNRQYLEPKLGLGHGVWFPELAPLGPPERTLVLNQLRSMWGIKESMLQ